MQAFSGVAAMHSFLKKPDGSVFAIGINWSGQLALNDVENRHEFTLVRWFQIEGRELKQASCGNRHSLFLMMDGDVWSCGSNKKSQLGIAGSDDQLVPKKIRMLRKVDIVSVACGYSTSFCLTKAGKVYAFGSNSSYQLGLGTCNDYIGPRIVAIPDGVKILGISAGNNHAAAIGEEGICWTWGYNGSGQLGTGENSRKLPDMVSLYPEAYHRSSMVNCGGDHTVFQHRNTHIQSCGCNTSGELGNGGTISQALPQIVVDLYGTFMKKVRIGGNHTIILLENGRLAVFGSNRHFQLCLGHNRKKLVPEFVSSLPPNTIPTSNVEDICCGLKHTLLITKDGKCYGVGSGESFGRECDNDLEKLTELADYKRTSLTSNFIEYIFPIDQEEALKKKLLLSTESNEKLAKELNEKAKALEKAELREIELNMKVLSLEEEGKAFLEQLEGQNIKLEAEKMKHDETSAKLRDIEKELADLQSSQRERGSESAISIAVESRAILLFKSAILRVLKILSDDKDAIGNLIENIQFHGFLKEIDLEHLEHSGGVDCIPNATELMNLLIEEGYLDIGNIFRFRMDCEELGLNDVSAVLDEYADEANVVKNVDGDLLVFDEATSDLIGKGGEAEVYKVKYIGIKTALKVILNNRERWRVMVEVDMMMKISNKMNIINVYGVLNTPHGLGILMEYAETNLETIVHSRKYDKDMQWRVETCLAILNGLEQIHKHGIVHRDLKLTNILIVNGVAKIADFGCAKDTNFVTNTTTGPIMSSAGYAAPERMRDTQYFFSLGRKYMQDSRIDIFSFALIAYEILTGKRVFGADGYVPKLIKYENGKYDIDFNCLDSSVRETIKKGMNVYPNGRPTLEIMINAFKEYYGSL